jgi:hypothetical protein
MDPCFEKPPSREGGFLFPKNNKTEEIFTQSRKKRKEI